MRWSGRHCRDEQMDVRMYIHTSTTGDIMAQFSLNNVHKGGLKHHHFISFTTGDIMAHIYSLSRGELVCIELIGYKQDTSGTRLMLKEMLFLSLLLSITTTTCWAVGFYLSIGFFCYETCQKLVLPALTRPDRGPSPYIHTSRRKTGPVLTDPKVSAAGHILSLIP